MKPISEMPHRETRNPYKGGGAGGQGAWGVARFWAEAAWWIGIDTDGPLRKALGLRALTVC